MNALRTLQILTLAALLALAIPAGIAKAQPAPDDDPPAEDSPADEPAADDAPADDPPAEEPSSSAAATLDFRNEGIFGCNQVAGASAGAGTLAAIGGVYVPVNDAAVTLNTGILVYKECVLRPLQVSLREGVTSSFLKKNWIGIETGREGNKYYVVNRPAERLIVRDRSRLATLQGRAAEGITPAYKDGIVRWSARGYRQKTRAPESALTCHLDDIDARIRNESENVLETIFAYTNPVCMPHLNAAYFEDLADTLDAQAIADWDRTLLAGRDFYPVTDNAENPFAENILTPAAVVQESYQQILGSPIRQLESANDVGQIIGALFSGVTTQALTDNRGLAGLGRSVGGRPAYLDQVARESSEGVIGAAVNAALTVLNAARQTEASFLGVMNSVASSLTKAINQLRELERECWKQIVPRAESYASGNGISLDGRKISAATSSLAFAQKIIDDQIDSLADVAIANVRSAERALGLVDELIVGVTNTNSLANQRLALQQLDGLVARNELHSQYDVQRAAQQRDDVQAAMTTLVTDTATAWANSTDPSVGWCNYNNETVIQLWAERWEQ